MISQSQEIYPRMARDFWRHHFGRLTGAASFPLDTRRAVGGSREKLSVEIPSETSTQLLRLAGTSDFLLYVVLVTGLQICLRKYSAADEIAIGVAEYLRRQI